MRLFTLFAFALLLSPTLSKAQSLPLERRSDWTTAGRQSPIPDYSKVLNILNFGGSGDSATLNEIPFQQAVAALQGQPGVIYFPPGKYLFHNPIHLRDSLIVRGEGSPFTTLYFDLGSTQQNCIVSRGTIVHDSSAFPLTQSAVRGDTLLYAETDLKPGDCARLQFDDSLLIFSSWALGSAGQLFDVLAATDSEILVNHPLRLDCDWALHPRLRKIDPVDDAGLECLKIKRLDPNVPIGSNILFEHSRRCWLVGVESEVCNFAHFTFDGSTHCEVYGCYAHDAFAYGGSGQGYGLVLEFTSSDNRAQNNIFKHLRHSMLLQSGANGNVLGYNFSTDPIWVEFPNDAAGEIVLHGNYPSYNLFEGNICENIRPDGSHGNNGPFNTLFRNRTTGYGLITTEPNYQHSLNILGNEIVPGGLFQGLYVVSGTDHFEQGNSQGGAIVPAGTPAQEDTSLYFRQLPSFLSGTNFLIGPPSAFNTASIPAKDRFFSGNEKTDCEARTGLIVGSFEPPSAAFQFGVYPNPASAECFVFMGVPGAVEIFDLSGKCRFSSENVDGKLRIPCAYWPAGLYLVRAKCAGKTAAKFMLKMP
ncbi:MAG: T9SS type A sorting domain-containing protein [Phycisphaerae bacterium]|nr:T9SS type A sorting domain-containing protein [Saprospiraceae bacterium]